MTAQPAPTWIGVQLGSYRIRDLIGEGGMGQVYRAYHVSTDRPAAIKVLFAGASQDAETLDRFRREAAILKEVQHPALVRILDSGNHESVPYVAFDLVEGRLLAGLLREHHRFAPPRALDIAAQIADGLAQMHARHVVHRDLKPENVMIRGDDQPCILDFGIAKHFGTSARTIDQVTQAGNLLGTLYYMPPELASSELSPAYDVWAIGVMLYEMVAGRRPFADAEELGVGEYFAAVRAGQYPKLSTVVPGGGARLDGLIAGMLQADPEKRVRDGAQAADAIRLVAVELGSAPGAAGQGWKATKARPAAVVQEQGGAARPLRTVAVDGAALSAGGGRPNAGASAKVSAPAMEFAKTPLTSQGLWERRAGYAMTLGGVALLTAGVAGSAFQKRMGHSLSKHEETSTGEARSYTAVSVQHSSIASSKRSAQEVLEKETLLSALRTLSHRSASKNINQEWLAKLLLRLKSLTPDIKTAARNELERDGLFQPLEHVIRALPKYITDFERQQDIDLLAALSGAELIEHCLTEAGAWPISGSLISLVEQVWKPLRKADLQSESSWFHYCKLGVHEKPEYDTHFLHGPITYQFSTDPKAFNPRAATMWIAGTRLGSHSAVELTLNRHRLILRERSRQDTDPGPIELPVGSCNIEGLAPDVGNGRLHILFRSEDEGHRSYLGRSIPTAWLINGKNSLTVQRIDLPGSEWRGKGLAAVWSKFVSVR